MKTQVHKFAEGLRAIVDNPVTCMVKGLALLLIGFADIWETLWDDLSHGKVRLGHGIILIGLFNMLDALPNLIESMEAGARYLELREKKRSVRAKEGSEEESSGART